MKKKRRSWKLLGFSFITLGAVVFCVIKLSPDETIMLGSLQIPTLPLLLLSLYSFIFSFFAYLLKSFTQGILIASLLLSIFMLRFFHLTHWIFYGLLVAIFFSLEFVFYRRSK